MTITIQPQKLTNEYNNSFYPFKRFALASMEIISQKLFISTLEK
jgi:hypothetical protein